MANMKEAQVMEWGKVKSCITQGCIKITKACLEPIITRQMILKNRNLGPEGLELNGAFKMITEDPMDQLKYLENMVTQSWNRHLPILARLYTIWHHTSMKAIHS